MWSIVYGALEFPILNSFLCRLQYLTTLSALPFFHGHCISFSPSIHAIMKYELKFIYQQPRKKHSCMARQGILKSPGNPKMISPLVTPLCFNMQWISWGTSAPNLRTLLFANIKMKALESQSRTGLQKQINVSVIFKTNNWQKNSMCPDQLLRDL